MEPNRIEIFRRVFGFLSIVLLGFAIALAFPMLAAQPAEQVPISSSPLKFAASPEVRLTQAEILLLQGTELYHAGRFAEAIAIWQQAASEFRTQDQSLSLALALSNLATAYHQLGEWMAAEDAIAQSLTLLQTLVQEADPQRHTPILARTLNHQGSLFWAQGQLEEAIDTWQQSAATYAAVGDETGVMGSLLNQARGLQTLGLSIQSEALLQQVSQRLDDTADPNFRAAGLRQLGSALRRVGKLDEARTKLTQSLTLAVDPNAQSSALLELGNLERAQRNRAMAIGATVKAQALAQEALNYYEQAATAAQNPERKMRAQLNRLSLLIEEGDRAKAIAHLPDLQTLMPTLPLGRTAVYARLNLAHSLICAHPDAVAVAASCQHFGLARSDEPMVPEETVAIAMPSVESISELLATALQMAQQLSDLRAQSYALGQLGELYELTQQWADAQALTEQALALTETLRAPEIRYRWEWQLGRLLERKANVSGAIAAYQRAIEELKAARNDLLLVDPEVQFSFRDNVEPVYRRLIRLLVSPDPTGPPSQSNLTQAIATIDALQLAELENYLGCNLAQRIQLSTEQVDPSAAIFHLMTLPQQLVVILKLPDAQDLTLQTIPISKQQVDTTLRSLRRELGKRYSSAEGQAAGQQVYDWVIRPVEAQLEQSQVKTLVFVLDGLMRSIPMAVLHDGQDYLLEKYAIALTPGPQLFKPEPLAQDRLQVQAFGIADFQSDNLAEFPHHENFGDLLYVAEELDQLQQYMPSDEFLDAQFTRQTLQTQTLSGTSPIVHIATHGQFSSDPRETFVIAWDEKIDVFQLSSILRRREERGSTPLKLLVLSACQTAAGDDRAILGLAGIAIQSGARSTLSSLWVIQDQSTAALMNLFYQALIDETEPMARAGALRRAQLQLMATPGYRAPYYWAPYVMVGGWL